jgi:hypothetical protein
MRILLAVPLLLLLTAAAEPEETPFDASAETFADAAACKARLAALAVEARTGRFDAVEGPYDLTPGDTRIHTVRAEGSGHRIAEHRCLAEKLSGRSWTHAMADAEPEWTIESAARDAPWLKKSGTK